MDTLSEIRSRLLPRALWHLEQADKVDRYQPVTVSAEDEEALSQLQDEALLAALPSGTLGAAPGSLSGPFKRITELGRQVLHAI